MTAFARQEQSIGSSHFVVEVRSVNHRYLDLRFRLPPAWISLESPLGELVRSKIQRGAVELNVRQKAAPASKEGDSARRFALDERSAKSLLDACDGFFRKHQQAPTLTLDLLYSTGILAAVEDTADAAETTNRLRALVAKTLDELVAERKREGEQIRGDLEGLLKALRGYASEWKKLAPSHPGKIRDRLSKRIKDWNLAVEAQRLETEVAFFADRADISEEIQRFEMHLGDFEKTVRGSGPVGRKLDFLTQELHRETNTVASKADDIEITRLAVEVKTAIEKLREQVQNVE